MAFGHGVKRKGFGGPDQKIKGDKGDVAETLEGGDGDDVIIAFDGDDQVVGQDGEDDLSGGGGDDLLVGAIWIDDDGTADVLPTDGNGEVDAEDTFVQDAFSDDFNAGSSFEANGSDTIWYYDGDTSGGDGDPYDVIDFSEALDFVDTNLDLEITAEEKEAQVNDFLDYDPATGQLTSGGNVWFTVFTDAGQTAAATVYVEVDGDQFAYNAVDSSWDLVA